MAEKRLQIEIVVDEKGAIKDVRQLGQEFDKVGKTGQDAFAKVDKSAASMGTALKAAAGAAAVAAASIAGIAVAAKAGMDAIAEIERSAIMAGVTTEAYQRLAYAAKQYQISQDALTDGLKELSLRADEFVVTGAGPALEAFKRLGLSQDELKKKMKDIPGLFSELIRRMEGLEDAAKIRIADELFGGTGGEQFVALVQGGSKALAQMTREADELGLVLDSKLIKNTVDAKLAIENLGAAIAAPLLVSLGEFSGWIVANESRLALFAKRIGEIAGYIPIVAALQSDWLPAAAKSIADSILPEADAIAKQMKVVADLQASVDKQRGQIFKDSYFAEKLKTETAILEAMKQEKSVQDGIMATEEERRRIATAKLTIKTTTVEVDKKAKKAAEDAAKAATAEVDRLDAALKSYFGTLDDIQRFDRDFLTPSWIENLNRDIENQIDAGNYWELGAESWISSIEKTEAAAKKAAEDSAQAAEEAAKESAEKAKEEYDRFLDGVQSATADVFFDMFKNVGDGWENLWDSAKNYVLRVLAEMAAAAATRRIVVPIVGYASGMLGGDTSEYSEGGSSISSSDYLSMANQAYRLSTGNSMTSDAYNYVAGLWGGGSALATDAAALGYAGYAGAGGSLAASGSIYSAPTLSALSADASLAGASAGSAGGAATAGGGVSLGSLGVAGALGSLGYTYIGGALGLPQGKWSGAGAGLGAAGGMALGAKIGSGYPVIGTIIGAVVGGVLSAFIGSNTKRSYAGGAFELSPDSENIFDVDQTKSYSRRLDGEAYGQIDDAMESAIMAVVESFGAVYDTLGAESQQAIFGLLEKYDWKAYARDHDPDDLMEEFAASLTLATEGLSEYLSGVFRKVFNMDYLEENFSAELGMVGSGSPLAALIEKLHGWTSETGTDTEFLQSLGTAMTALGEMSTIWDDISLQAERMVNPLSEYESAQERINTQFDAWVVALENLGFAEFKIAEIEAYRVDTLANLAQAEADRIAAEQAAEAERAANEAARVASERAASMASVAEAQAGIAGRDYRMEVMAGRYGWESIPGMDVLASAVQAFASMDYDEVVALADRFGVSVGDLTADMTYLNGIISENASAAEAEAEARRQSSQAIRDQIAAMREQISMTLYQARGGSMAAYYMDQFRAIQGAPMQSMESLGNAADNLGAWYSAVVSDMQEAARLWAQVGDITSGLIRTIDDTILSIKTGALSNALPNQRFASGDAEYRRLRAAATGSDATQTDLQAFAGFAQSYLGLAQENFKSSSTYDQIRDTVLGDLESIRGDLASGGYEGAILAELESLNDNLDLSQVNATFENLAGWIERNIRQLETSGLTLQIDFGDIPEDVRSVLEKWAAVIQENGANSQLAVDFLVSATAGGTNILWPEFENVIAQMGGSYNTINRMQTIYDDAAGGALPWASVQELIDANEFGLTIQTKLKGEYEKDGLTLSELQEILLASNVSPDLIRRITTELTGNVEADLNDGVTTNIASISTQVDRMFGWYTSLNSKLGSIDSSLSGGTLTSARYTSLNNKLGDIAANTAATVAALNNLSAHGDGTVTRGPELAMIGERGPEAVIPLKNGEVPVQLNGALLSGGQSAPQNITLHIEIEGEVFEARMQRIADNQYRAKARRPSVGSRRTVPM